ncbi:MAG: threonine--tRNA ligase [Myxococcota bacterium]
MNEEEGFGRDDFASEDEYRLYCLRHSTAHIMAQAVQRLHPTARLAIGPPVQDGFYYDIEIPGVTLSEDDLTSIEAEMKAIVKDNQPFEMEEVDRDALRAELVAADQPYKVEMLDGFEGAIKVCRNPSKKTGDTWSDMCRGPHVMRTGQCKHFKLLKIAGAYWRGDANNPQLQRLYGTVWPNREQLDQYLYRLEEAKKRDHRKLGQQLDLFMFHDWAPGAAFWLPNGEVLYHILADRMRTLLLSDGYVAVRTPLLFDKKLFETSGHWDHYQENLFHFAEGHFHEGTAGEDEEHKTIGLKPMNCPSHMLIFGSRKRSYRELPMRIHDQGVLHRNELSGALSGLTRVRQFSQDDGHIFCAEDQIADEVQRLLTLVDRVYGAFGMEVKIHLSTRPADKLGSDDLWDRAEAALELALKRSGIDYGMKPGDGAFYGPKIDFDVFDALGRGHQCATVQLDFQLPRRFELSYVGADNTAHTPVVIHRAVVGSFERFIGVIIEHYAGNFPVWLAPEQVRVMTVSEKSVPYGRTVLDALAAAGVRATFDDGDEKIGYKIRECHGKKVPYMLVIGEKEAEDGTVNVRSRDSSDTPTIPLADFLAKIAEEGRIPF